MKSTTEKTFNFFKPLQFYSMIFSGQSDVKLDFFGSVFSALKKYKSELPQMCVRIVQSPQFPYRIPDTDHVRGHRYTRTPDTGHRCPAQL